MHNPDAHEPDLAERLWAYGVSLREAGRYEEVVLNASESVVLVRELYQRDAKGKYAILALCLISYVETLTQAGDSANAAEAEAELDAIAQEYNYDADQLKCLCKTNGCSG